MPKNHIISILPFTHRELFDLVQDIEKYPEFLPWCSAARIINKSDNIIHAELIISYKAFRAKYISCVERIEGEAESTIRVSLIEGPFKYLNNLWHFQAKNDETQVTFVIDFELKIGFMNKIVNDLFEKIFTKMHQAFYDRAKKLYNHDSHIT